MRISLIIVTYNDTLSLKLILESIKNQSLLPYEVIIADDGSTNETRNCIEQEKQNFPCILQHVWHEDKGFRASKIRNEAIKITQGDVIIFSDGDLVFHKHYVKDFSKAVKPKYAFIGTRAFLTMAYTNVLKEQIKNQQKTDIKIAYNRIEKNYLNTIRIPFIYKLWRTYTKPNKSLRGGLLAIWKTDLLSVKGFDEQFEGWGKEDTDLVIRLINNGIIVRKLKHSALTLHLKHPINSINRLPYNEELLEKVIQERKVFPNIGLNIDVKYNLLSIAMITYNEGHIIEKNLQQLKKIANEIIIIDNGSTDKTIEIAQQYGAKVYLENWKGFGLQKQSAVNKCTSNWILSIDADEILTPIGIQNIQQTLAYPDNNIYALLLINICLGKRLRGGYKPKMAIRMFRNKLFNFNDNLVHESIDTKNEKIGDLKGISIDHYTRLTINSIFDSLDAYANYAAKEKIKNGETCHFGDVALRPIFTFLKFYILNFGFIEGKIGYILAKAESYYKFKTYLLVYYQKYKKQV